MTWIPHRSAIKILNFYIWLFLSLQVWSCLSLCFICLAGLYLILQLETASFFHQSLNAKYRQKFPSRFSCINYLTWQNFLSEHNQVCISILFKILFKHFNYRFGPFTHKQLHNFFGSITYFYCYDFLWVAHSILHSSRCL